MKNKITFEANTGYCLVLLVPGTRILLKSSKSKISKYENGQNVCHLETTEQVFMHCNIANNDYQQYSKVLLVINHLVNC